MRKLIILMLSLGLGGAILSDEQTLFAFAAGMAAGFLLSCVLAPWLGVRRFAPRILALLRYHYLFLWELMKSSYAVAKIVLIEPVANLTPDFLVIDIRDLSGPEVFLLANSITLTPGTTTVEVQRDAGRMTVHVLENSDPEQVRADIEQRLRRPILAFTRP